uniref:Uncharacterized protein n=1 Tax=Nicotiana tabacum TaxID=4097 RepID=A0A1S4A274_TOBAC|nr:PREDICTED: uncharacterized protein LOC107793027 [Nicotiana tabacum]
MRPMTTAQDTHQQNTSTHSETAATPAAPATAAPATAAQADGDAIFEDEDEHPVLRPKVISEAKTRLQKKEMRQMPTGTRKIAFKGDESGTNVPTNLPYSPRKVTWKGKAAITSRQLLAEKENKVGKLKVKKIKL